MKKIAIAVFIIACFSAGICAAEGIPGAVTPSATVAMGGIFVKFTSGFTSVSMAKANSYLLDKWKPLLDNHTYEGALDSDPGGVLMTLDAGYEFMPGFSGTAGVRYLISASSRVRTSYQGEFGIFWFYDEAIELKTSLIPVVAGVNYSFTPKGGPVLGAGLNAGYAFLTGSMIYTPEYWEAPLIDYNRLARLEGGAFTLEAVVSIGFKPSEFVTLDFETGYRICNVSAVTLKDDFGQSTYYYAAGDTLKDDAGNNVELDMSGFFLMFGAKTEF